MRREFITKSGDTPRSTNSMSARSVTMSPATSRNVPGGVYEVIKRLADNGGEPEYRIKSANEPHERVARESKLTRA